MNRLLMFLLTRNTPEDAMETNKAGKLSDKAPNPGGSSEKRKYIQDLSDPFG